MISEKGIAMKFLHVLVVLCLFVSGDGDAEVRCIEREREALLSFKNGLIDEYGDLSSWRSDECCEWAGVVCSNTTAHVISLNLEDYYPLRGKVSSSLLELHHLHYLNLNWIDFGGNPIPEFIGSMKQLRHLYLRRCNFSGIVPPQIGNLTSLLSLDLSSNPSLRGENLDWLSSLSLLSFLDLSEIDLSSTNWLQHIQSLPSLRELNLLYCNISDIHVNHSANSPSTSLSILDMSRNHLTSSSFDWLPNISSTLVKLDLSSNSLSGPIPNTIERLIRIEHLDLSYNSLSGPIPNTIERLIRIEHLDLSYNSLSGPIPNTIERLIRIEHLDLSFNMLEGEVLPKSLTNLSRLRFLDLHGNKFNGLVADNMRAFSELQVLDLSNNSLEGTVSESHFIKLHSLKELDLSSNSLVIFDIAPDWSPPFQLYYINLGGCNVGPSFPEWIQTQTNLSFLDLSGGGITSDEVPRWLWSTSPSLERLFLSHNQISGTIPNLSSISISVIDLSYNNFSGPIPLFNPNASAIQLSGNMFSGSISSLCKLPLFNQLRYLDLSNNQLTGEVPNCWEKMPELLTLNLANNSFLGEIPRSFGSLRHLNHLQLRGNNLSGEFPSTLRLCQHLAMIDVGGNELTEEIPSWIGDMYMMIILNFGRNRLHGSIPPAICNLTHIHVLDLSINNLSGKIPDCFNNFTALAQKGPSPSMLNSGYYYQYSSLQWKGQQTEYKKENFELIKLIDFSSNRLSGNIPQSISSMMGLMSLNLSQNSLTGCIIPDIGEMEMLESLDLSQNHLSGEIPTSMARLHFLSVLNLSNNSLSGRIPSSTQLQSFNASAYAGNAGLCGDPLPLCPGDSLRPSSTNPGENMNDKDDSIFSFMQEVAISMGFGFIFGFWGVVGSFIVKKSWRNAYFNFFDDAKDWFYVRTALFVSKWRPG